MIMDFILFSLTVHGKKIAKSGYSAHSSMRASNIISPEGKGKGALCGDLFKITWDCSSRTVPLLNSSETAA